MFSIGAYHENIVNLQGIGYEVDETNKCISQVRKIALISNNSMICWTFWKTRFLIIRDPLSFFQYSIILEYCSKGNVLSHIREHYNDLKTSILQESTSMSTPKSSSGFKSGNPLLRETRKKKSIHSASLLVIWSHQVKPLIK